jgi:signal transduction histidine kinase
MFAKLYVKLYLWFLLVFAVTQVVNFTITSRIFRSRMHEELETQFRHEADFLYDQFQKNCSDVSRISCSSYLKEVSGSLKWNFWVVNAEGKMIIQEATHSLDRTLQPPDATKRAVTVFIPETPFMAFYPIQDSGMILALEREVPHRPRFPFIGFFVTATVIIAILVLPLSIRLTQPLRKLNHVASEWSEGRLERRLTIKGNDEISDLSRVFNEMAANLKRIIDQRKEFLALISHELKSPLTRMRLALQMIGDHNSDERTGNLLARIQREISESEALVERILALSKIEMDISDPTVQEANLRNVLKASLTDVAPVANLNRVTVDFDGRTSENAFIVAGDPEQLRHAFSNIIENAVKFSPAHSRVYVGLSRSNGSISVHVSDHGPGVAVGDYEKIFEPFYRGNKTNGKKGTGLGLFISHRIIEKHHGTIQAYPNEPSGITIQVTLPSPH